MPSTTIKDYLGHYYLTPLYNANAVNANGSAYGIRNSINNHEWYGVLSTLNRQLTSNLNFGVDARTYKGTHFREMRELIGAAYYKDPFNANATVDANATSYWNVTKVTPVTNRVAYDYDGLVDYYGTFGQLEYSKNKLSAFISGAVNETKYGRVDRYNATHTAYNAQKVSIDGFNLKAGANYNLDEHNNLFVNVGKYSRAPYLSFIYNGTTTTTNPNSGNAVNKPIKNEEAQSVEAGYGYRTHGFRFKLNGYYTEFQNRSLTSPLLTNADGTQYRALISGQGALHKGVEANVDFDITKAIEVNGFASFGDWKWKGNAAAVVHDDVKNTDTKVNVYSDNLYVGDQPQTQFGGYVRIQISKNLDFSTIYTYNAKYYAYYDPSSRTNPAVTAQPYKLPDFGVGDARIGYKFKISKLPAYAQYQVYNVLDKNYWVEANDGSGTAAGTLGSGFKGWGRTSNVSLKINF